jgi:hypothetical protein
LQEGKVDFSVADKIRQGIGKNLGSIWQTDNPKFNQDVRMTIWKELVNTIRPATNTTTEFQKLSAYTQASMKIEKVLESQSKRLGVGISDLLTGLGFGIGKGGMAGVLSVAAKRVAESPVARTSTAVVLNELNKILPKLPWDATGKISREVLINAIKNLGD